MRIPGVSICVWLLLVATGWTSAPPLESGQDHFAVDTTLVDTVAAGSVYIKILPASLQGEDVASYKALRIPAMGWVADRSFFWRIPSDAVGTHRFEFRATRRGGTDLVTLQLAIRPPDA